MRWAEKERMQFIETQLCQTHQLNRRDLTAKFGISVPQASNDIRKFMDLNPGRMHYDPRRRSYFALKPKSVKGRDTTAAAQSLIYAKDEWLQTVALHDPDMIRDIAAALLYERGKE